MVHFIGFFRVWFLFRKYPSDLIRALLRVPLGCFVWRPWLSIRLLSLPFVFVRDASVLRTDSLVEGLFSSTRAETRLRLTFAASFLFHFSSAFLFCCFDPSVPQCRLSNEIYAGTLICSARLLAFIGVTLLEYDFIFFELRLLVCRVV